MLADEDDRVVASIGRA